MRMRLVVFLLIASSSLVFASPLLPCPSSTMVTYISPGFRCTVDGLLFSNFTFASEVSGPNAAPLTPNLIAVDAISNGLMFTSDYWVGDFNCNPYFETCPGGMAQSLIGYMVRALGNELINGLTFRFNGYSNHSTDIGGTPKEYGNLSGRAFDPISFYCIEDTDCPADGWLEKSVTSPGVHTTNVLYLDLISATGGATAGWNNSTQQFSLIERNVPEPATLFLVGPWLAAGGLMLRYRKSRQ